MKISLIWAMARNRVIGKDNRLPWNLPDEMAYFRRLTSGHVVIMGRRTFESMNCRPLPNRVNIVVSSKLSESDEFRVAQTVDDALRIAGEQNDKECFVIGGSSMYKDLLPRANRLYCTIIDAEIVGDTRFPLFDWSSWVEVSSEKHDVDERHAFAYECKVFEKKLGLNK